MTPQTAINIELLKAEFIDAKDAAEHALLLTAPLDAELTAGIERVKAEHYAKHAERYKLAADVLDVASLAESNLRNGMTEIYKATGEKTIDANLSVRVNTKLEYEMPKAVAWAEQNAPVMIVKAVDKKAFESLPTVADLEFVFKTETPVAVIKGI